MNILGIDTSTTSGSVAILKDEEIVAELTLNLRKTHSERLLPSIDNLLRECGLGLEDMDAIAVTTGPGSFTGLRIGLSSAKGLGWALNKPILGVSTLLSLACNIPYSSYTICPILDARKGEVYSSLFSMRDGALVREMEDMVLKPEHLAERLAGEVLFLGDGIKKYGEYFKKHSKKKGAPRFAPPALWNIRASNVCRLGLFALNRGEGKGAKEVSLDYIRPSEAELKTATI